MIKGDSMKDLTKAELIEKLEEQKHLAEAVEAKDIEMSKLEKKYKEKITKLHEEVIELSKKVHQVKEKHKHSITEKQMQERIKTINKEKERAQEVARLYVKMHHDLLKQTQQNLEMALFTEQVVSDKFKK